MSGWYCLAPSIILLAACFTDLRSRKIPNQLILVGVFLGLVINCIIPIEGRVIYGLEGLMLGLGLMLVPYAFKMMGAGDVKLFAVMGLFFGSSHIIMVGLHMMLWGGVLALYYLIKMKRMKRLDPNYKKMTLPYALAITAGSFSTMYLLDWNI